MFIDNVEQNIYLILLRIEKTIYFQMHSLKNTKMWFVWCCTDELLRKPFLADNGGQEVHRLLSTIFIFTFSLFAEGD